VSRNPNQTYYSSGTIVSVTATPANGYAFTGWSGSSSSKNTALSGPIDRNLSLTANFYPQSMQQSAYLPPSAPPPPPIPIADIDGLGIFTDSRDGKKYKTVVIGGKRWMGANLNYLPPKGNSWCYNNDNSKCGEYGRLYYWKTAKTVCPSGWHLPSRQEWDNLVTAVGGANKAGKMLKARKGWNNRGNGKDEYGFSALPGGRYYGSGFGIAGLNGYWWTATEYDDNSAYIRRMRYDDDNVYDDDNDESDGLSVRCVKD